MRKTIRLIMTGAFFGLSIAVTYHGFVEDSTKMQLLGIWLVGATIVGLLSGNDQTK